MRVIIMGEQPVFSEINRKEEITPETYLLTDKEEHDIRESLEKGGEVYVTADKRLVCQARNPTPTTPMTKQLKLGLLTKRNSKRN